jgi:hypothetical protein
VSRYTVWLKTLNLALMGGTPHYIHLFLLSWFLPLFLLLFYFSVLLLCFLFIDKKGILVQVWKCAMSHASPDSPLTPSPGQLFPCNYTLRTMCTLSLGVWEHNFTHLVSLKKYIYIFLHVHVVLKFWLT